MPALVELQERIKTLGDVPRVMAAHHGSRVALEFEGRRTTYAAFDARTNQVAKALLAAGLKPGDRIGHLGKNTDRYFELMFGAAKAGVVLTPINWRLAPAEVEYILRDCGAQLCFVGPEFAETVARFAPETRADRRFIGVEGAHESWMSLEDWLAGASPSDPGLAIDPASIAMQLYTSGTTGRPKGAMLAHRSMLGLRETQRGHSIPWNEWGDHDASLVAMPVFHIGGSGWGLMGLYNGAFNLITREFDPSAVLDIIERYGIAKIFLVPAAMQFVVRQPKARQTDYSKLKYIMYGASPIPLELLRECIEVFGCGFVQMYGMTETCGTIVALPPEDHDPAGSPRMRSAGKALPGVELAILDAEGNRLPPGEVGEIATRSPANMTGYWGLPEATAKTIDAEGWLRTGDAGYLDEDGYLYIHDRVKDMIISGGENIYPAEVENAIFGHPDVADVAVIGVPSERWGEEVKAVVVPKPGRSIEAESIIAWARERIAHYKAPKSVDVIEALPRNPSGKILRRELREPYWAGRERRVS